MGLRAVWAAVGVALLWVALESHAPWDWPFWVALLAPDVAFLYGMTAGRLERGQIHPRAVRLYNLLHFPGFPMFVLALALAGAAGLVPARPSSAPLWTLITIAVAWLLHIAVDRALGWGPRDREGFQRYRTSR